MTKSDGQSPNSTGFHDRALVIVPQIGDAQAPSEGRLTETAGLVEALNAQVIDCQVMRVRQPTAGELFGKGQVEILALRAAAEQISLVIIDASVSPVQQRNLERSIKVKIVDRTGLILEIFGLRARTSEGRVQVEMARLLYERSRLVRTWTHLERQRGGFGFMGGPGETQIEADRRQLDDKIRRRRSELAEIKRTREVQRAGRRKRSTQVVALVGYTNAGKSTLFNALSGADVFVKDMPFATLDPTVRQIVLGSGRRVELVDTAGFITDLPTNLVAAFRATLEETMLADLIVHVRDVSDPESLRQKNDVMQVLKTLETETKLPIPPMIEVWNKVDRLDEHARNALEVLQRTRPPGEPEGLMISATSGQGLEALGHALDTRLAVSMGVFSVHISAADGLVRSSLYDRGAVLSEMTHSDGRARLQVLLERAEVGRLLQTYPGLELNETSLETGAPSDGVSL